MTKVYGQLAVLGLVAAFLSACQSIDTVRIKHVKETESSKTNALIYCAGTANCEFERLNKIQIIDAAQRRVNSAAVESGILRLQANSLSQPNALYLSIPPGQHEVVIRFYPISRDRAETLHVFHQFKPKQRYIFKMYRERNKQQGSLLNVSAPEPLCVDLLQEHKTIRRFCRPYNALTGLGEFVEKKI
ncbi:hypothetical protein GCM10023345_01880 [Acinetobacter kookii]|jgi:hypothetical protein|uniref:Lipoprotein n=1 Tax=Acinetobacter kookii TaxID=1226327 RepID=A0A1G6HNC6_9GAMM|nr:hypothetical protein [Acinetobacter kookii]UDM37922.1 hypothetical protein LIS44_12875 [Acinetobacter haemolyticus]SDB95752.1 hypothetical protein SAMN05421732_102118 [Acinetobacter kookii]